ncbi:hypothetical protein SUGI_0231930 [Cryptomeria japonica]|nr:hypothetical protein SUGI_0231930 [Cryptomeria japonica]
MGILTRHSQPRIKALCALRQICQMEESARRTVIDDISETTGENERPLPDELQGALQAVYKRYSNYLDACKQLYQAKHSLQLSLF